MHTLLAATILLAAATSAIPLSRFEYDGKTYLIVSNEQASWFDAASFCFMKSMNLASFQDNAEFDYINEQLIARGLQNAYVWIGGTEIGDEDNYYWFNQPGLVDLPHWDPSETFDDNEKCMAMYKGFWQHYLCSTATYFICESMAAASTTTTTTTTTTRPSTTTTRTTTTTRPTTTPPLHMLK